jgi:ribonuclease R
MHGDLVEVVRLRRLEAERRNNMQKTSAQQLRVTGGKRAAEGSNSSGDQQGTELLGSVKRVVERAHTTLVGIVREADGLYVVVPDDERITRDIFLGRSRGCAVKDGDVVVVRITTYPGKTAPAQGIVEEIIGHEDERGVDMEVIIRKHGLEVEFSAAVLAEAEELAAANGAGEFAEQGAAAVCGAEELAAHGAEEASGVVASAGPLTFEELKRRDIRERFVFTIDPADARDFDDALSVDYVDGKLRLGVHIADVSAYVAWDSALDLTARRRATSVYLPDRVIPMLPAALSDDLCSLRPHCDRRAFTVDMYVRKDGTVESAEFYPSYIHSAARLSYEQAQELLEGEELCADELSIDEADKSILSGKLKQLHELAKKRTSARSARGAIDFDRAESRVVLDEQGAPIEVYLRKKTDATSLVEEAMILANETVAAYLLERNEPCAYRIHDEPLQSTLEELVPTLQEFGYALQGALQSSSEIQEILTACKGKPEYDLISTLLLRAMKRAQYHTVFSTHFGLASTAYAHFTSPIRRYPDLMVHRLLKLRLLAEQQGFASTKELYESLPKSTPKNTPKSATNLETSSTLDASSVASTLKQLDWICEHCSEQEREAEQATSEAIKLKLCEYFASQVGKNYEGIISGVNSYGFYVRESATHAEGFVQRDTLDEGCVYEAARFRWIDHDTNKAYRLGQMVAVELVSVNLARSEMQFSLKSLT